MSFLEHPVEHTLDQCIKCNICVTKCPVTAVTDLFPGPKYEGPQAGRFRMHIGSSPDKSVDYCSGCRVCNMACPTGVKIAEINARSRARMVEQGKFSYRNRLRNNLIARSELLGKIGQPLSPLANILLSNRLLRQAVEVALGIHQEAPLPPFSPHRFSSWFHRRTYPHRSDKKVVYFHGCSTEYFEPRVGIAAVQVLEAMDFEVIVPPQNCCGLPLLSNGEFPAARRYHASNLRHLSEFARQGIPIVGTSTSCTLTLKEEAIELLDLIDRDGQVVAQQTFDINEFILSIDLPVSFGHSLKPIPLTLAYHAPCQYRAHRLGNLAVEVLKLIPELQILESNRDCCGIAGTYGYKKEKYKIAMDIGNPLFKFVHQSGGPVVICDSETCRWQITHGTGIPAVHPIELLAAALGIKVDGPLIRVL